MNDISKSVGNATKWSVFTEIVIKIISPINNMILARLLMPEAFGVVATVTMIVSFTDIFTDVGFQKYVIQHQFKSKEDEDLSVCVAFWTNFLISIILWITIFIFSNQIAYAVGNDGLGKVIYIGALILPLTSFSSIQTALFRKKLDYKSISFARIAVKTVPLIVTVPLAILGVSYWALIIGNISGELCNAVLLTHMSNWKPKFRYSFIKLREMFQFCAWTLLQSISSWMVTNIGIFIIGRLFNEYYLGIYKTATTMVAQITSLITGATISVLFSSLSRLQNDDEAYYKMYSNFLRGIGLFVVPLGFGIFFYRSIVRGILLGGQWGDADLLVGLWGFILAESVIFNDMSGIIILSKGKPQFLVAANTIQAICMIPALYVSAHYGFKALVITCCVVRLQLPITQTLLVQKVSAIRVGDVFGELKWYIFSSIIMSIAAFIMSSVFSNIALQFISIIICIGIYFTILLVVPETRSELFSIVVRIKMKVVRSR